MTLDPYFVAASKQCIEDARSLRTALVSAGVPPSFLEKVENLQLQAAFVFRYVSEAATKTPFELIAAAHESVQRSTDLFVDLVKRRGFRDNLDDLQRLALVVCHRATLVHSHCYLVWHGMEGQLWNKPA